jgi:hypothetical protein
MNIYERIIDFVERGAGVIGTDILFWVGIGVVGLALLLGIIRLALLKTRLRVCYFRRIAIFIAWLYLIFAYFVVSTANTITWSNLIIYMAYPIMVVVAVYMLAFAFFPCRYCKDHGHRRLKKEKHMEESEEVQDGIEEVKEPKIKPEKIDKKAKKAEKKEAKKAERAEKAAREEEQKQEEEQEQQEQEPERAETILLNEADEEPKFEEPAFVIPTVEPIDAGYKEEPITPAPASTADRLGNISRLAEEIERSRQNNIKITDGAKESKFPDVAAASVSSSEPKVVARRYTETVRLEPKPAGEPKMGFTARMITERKVSDNSYTGRSISASNTTTMTETKKSTDDILSALERLRKSMESSGKK